MKKTHRTRNILLIILASVVVTFGGTSAYYISQMPVKEQTTKTTTSSSKKTDSIAENRKAVLKDSTVKTEKLTDGNIVAGTPNTKAAEAAKEALKVAAANATARSHGFKDAATEAADNKLGFVTDDFSVVSEQKGDFHPITANNLPWQIAPKQAVDNADNCVVFVWQYMWDTYHVSIPYIVASSTDNSQITAAEPSALRQTPAAGEVAVFGPKGKLYTDQLGNVDVAGTGHVMAITSVNSDGSFNALDSGTKLGWGGVETHVKPSADVNYYDFRLTN